MREMINVYKVDLSKELHKFDNKDVRIIFFGGISGRFKLQKIKTEVEKFEVSIYDTVTRDRLIFNLCDIFKIKKSVKDDRRLYLYLEDIGVVAIVG